MANHPNNLALRFILELTALFALGYWGWAFSAAGRNTWALVFGVVVVLHYLVSYDRIRWPLQT